MQIVWLFFLAYALMLPMVAVHVLFNWKILHYEGYTSLEQLKKCGPRVEAYAKTMPLQPLYNLLVFGFLSLRYCKGLSPFVLLCIGLAWLALAAITDLLTWALFPHPWRLSFRELYVGHQPYLSLCYLCILLSPMLALF